MKKRRKFVGVLCGCSESMKRARIVRAQSSFDAHSPVKGKYFGLGLKQKMTLDFRIGYEYLLLKVPGVVTKVTVSIVRLYFLIDTFNTTSNTLLTQIIIFKLRI